MFTSWKIQSPKINFFHLNYFLVHSLVTNYVHIVQEISTIFSSCKTKTTYSQNNHFPSHYSNWQSHTTFQNFDFFTYLMKKITVLMIYSFYEKVHTLSLSMSSCFIHVVECDTISFFLRQIRFHYMYITQFFICSSISGH